MLLLIALTALMLKCVNIFVEIVAKIYVVQTLASKVSGKQNRVSRLFTVFE